MTLQFAAAGESPVGTFRTCRPHFAMSAIRGKTEVRKLALARTQSVMLLSGGRIQGSSRGISLVTEHVERRLAAVLAADIAGYSRLMGADEEGTLARLKAVRKALVDPTITKHRGRIVKTTGDGILVEFASAVDAVRGAVEVQRGMADQNASVPQDQRIEFRIGIHVGDIIIDDNDIFGDGVNVAARVESECARGGVLLSGSAFEQVRGKAEFAFEDVGEKPLKNIERPVRLYAVHLGAIATAGRLEPTTGTDIPLALPDKPSIAVLPLLNMSGNPEQEYFADGLTENITTDLSRFKELFVIGRNTAFTYKGKSRDLKRVGKELGVQYILEGSVQRSGDKLRVNVQLIDALEGGHLWAERLDRNSSDLFAIQDEVSRRVAFSLSDQIRRDTTKHLEARRQTKPESVDFVLRARADSVAGTAQGKVFERLRLFERAVELDHNNGDAIAGVARHKANLVFAGWSQSPTEDLKSALQYAERALELNADNAAAWFAKGQTFLASKRFAAALDCYDRAVELNPSHPNYRQLQAVALIGLGRSSEAFEPVQEAIRLSPRDMYIADFYMTLGAACWDLNRYPEAIDWLNRSVAQNPKIEFVHFLLASSYLRSDRRDEATISVKEVLAINPLWTIARVRSFYPIRDVAMSKLAGDLSMLGLPEI